ncbi:cytochrome P450 [Ganoderma sinense ZZ0214-1]|uniref:Cytochrome P450 n=1 Tax=Ganoderma sinense ZZ0214-1 TaxID=1077348 RepID=A0A2G8S6H6_9APHY|nr:cytochrome P450 [Ganoderma sinense ZZ0214-1]
MDGCLIVQFAHSMIALVHPSSVKQAILSSITSFILALISTQYSALTTVGNAQDIVLAFGIHLISLFCSVFIYRISPFHPLSSFPGPILPKITKFWGVSQSWTGRQHRTFLHLHEIYGPFVRTGPNELSIAHAQAVNDVLGAGGLDKGEWYSARQDPNAPKNLIVLTGEAHANRRRLWNRALSNENLTAYQPVIANRIDELVRHLVQVAAQSEIVDIGQSIAYFTFDFMGDMAFGGPFHMLSDGGDKNDFWGMLNRFAISASVVSHIPWAFPLVQAIPSLSKDLRRLRRFGVESATGRLQEGSKTKDLWYHLSDEAELEKMRPLPPNVVADGALAVIAGADTTAGALTALIYFVLSDATTYHKLRNEVDTVYPAGSDATDATLHDRLVWMDACINETLRLQPPVPTNGPRQVSYDGHGVIIAGRYVPPGTQVYVPPYAIHRDARYFSPSPECFLPSRWLPHTPEPEHPDGGFVLDRSAFIPFSYGPANCVGRHLARMEMKMVLSVLVQKFNLQFAEDFDSKGWCDTIKDYLVTSRGPLVVKLTPRDGSL